jgi:hypothetical protein
MSFEGLTAYQQLREYWPGQDIDFSEEGQQLIYFDANRGK